jgi:hypothetical protein
MQRDDPKDVAGYIAQQVAILAALARGVRLDPLAALLEMAKPTNS